MQGVWAIEAAGVDLDEHEAIGGLRVSKGALEFAVRETEVHNQRGEPVATLINTLVQRNG